MSAPTYEEFVAGKIAFDERHGFPIADDDVHPILLPHQRDLVRWAVAGGRRAIFAAFGLGKTVMQLETIRLTLEQVNPHAAAGLIVCPLGVRQEFRHDARMLGMDVRFIRRNDEFDGPGIYLTNYESIRDGRLDPGMFDAVSLDEASVLRSFGSKTYQTFLTLFDGVPYRFLATATPSPNRYKELIHYAGYLGIMDTGQALTRFFQRDSTKANNLTLYPHKEREFWLWLNTWAAFLQSPADLGHDATGYDLPSLAVEWHNVDVDHSLAGEEPDGQGLLYRGGGPMGVVQAAREKRETIEQRIDKMMEIVHGYVGGREEGQASGLSARVLPKEPGAPYRGTEGAHCPTRPGGAEGISPGLLGEEPRTAVGGPAGAREAKLSSQAGPVSGTQPEVSDQVVRADGDRVRCDGARAGRGLPDLHESDGASGDRSLPRDGASSRTALPPMQCGPGSTRGQRGGDSARSRVPDQLVIWCDLNDEQRLIESRLSEAGISFSSIYGSLPIEEAERRMAEWRAGETVCLIGKPVMLGQGVNLQQANKAIFVGISHRFNDLIQACHRIQRFGQTRPCVAHIIHADSETEIKRELLEKWARHKELTSTMTSIIREHGLDAASIHEELQRAIGVERVSVTGEAWELANNDCVNEVRDHMADNSVGLIVTSIPFANHYEYTPNYNDFGHTDNNDHFWAQMDYLTPELLRVLAPGRIYACHVKDRINFGGQHGTGLPTVSPFHVEATMHARKHGFDYLGMVTVVTDVVRENNQTYRLSYSSMLKDGSTMGVGSPEYVLLFHKPQSDRSKGFADVPIAKDRDAYSLPRWQLDASAFWRSSGNRPLTAAELAGLSMSDRIRLFKRESLEAVYDHEAYVTIGDQLDAHGVLPRTFTGLPVESADPWVWTDVDRMRTLNGEQVRRNVQMHVCPLQFDIVERLIARYSNPGDLVFDPFGGLGTVPLTAVRMNRHGRASELNAGYWADSVRYLREEDENRKAPTLFDLLDLEATA